MPGLLDARGRSWRRSPRRLAVPAFDAADVLRLSAARRVACDGAPRAPLARYASARRRTVYLVGHSLGGVLHSPTAPRVIARRSAAGHAIVLLGAPVRRLLVPARRLRRRGAVGSLDARRHDARRRWQRGAAALGDGAPSQFGVIAGRGHLWPSAACSACLPGDNDGVVLLEEERDGRRAMAASACWCARPTACCRSPPARRGAGGSDVPAPEAAFA